jgi:excisionase family DNA binding protein
MVENFQDYLTVGAAAELLGVSAKTLREWDRAGKLKPIRHPINKYRLYARKDLEAFLHGLAEARAAIQADY